MLRTAAERTTRQHPLECPVCEGLGQDEHSTTEVVRRKARDAHGVMREHFVTLRQGSGCLRCGGVGRVRSASYVRNGMLIFDEAIDMPASMWEIAK